MRVGVVDIGTNSMRLLVTSNRGEVGRWVEVTGLGEGIDSTGRLSPEPIERTVGALARFGEIMDRHGVTVRKAIATSASRDAANRADFFDKASEALGVRPTLIDGDVEARYAFDGAVGNSSADVVVSDIGGGSTEFVTASGSVSVDIGSVRLGERCLPDRPPGRGEVSAARDHVADLFSTVTYGGEEMVGVAGTWTSLAAVDLELVPYDSAEVHGHVLTLARLDSIIDELSQLDMAQTRDVRGLDPARARVILPGAIVAAGVMSHLGHDAATVSEMDTLDGVAKELLAQPQS